MVVAGRQRSIAFFIALGAGVVTFILLLYVGWVLLKWHTGILVFFGVLLLGLVISGVVLNTTFLVREIRRNEQHDAFINAVTHELKTPIASIRLYLETLQARQVDENRRQEFYKTMLADSDRLLSTVEQVLRTGRMRVSRRLLHYSAIDLHALIEDCMARACVLHKLQAGALQYKKGAAISIQGDPDEVQAAVSNLLDNAVKYSGGNIKVLVEAAPVDDKYVAVRVRDEGAGIPKAELKRIFQRFYRIPGPLAARLKGTWLGLYIVRSVAKRHGGRVWAESEGPGRGSTFVLQLPIVR
jgi:two-component system sensor histidine kinase SenX3